MPDQEAETFAPETRADNTAEQDTAGGVPAARLDGAAPLPPSIGRYRIIRLLGEGGMGAVYEAEQQTPQRIVALKVIRAGYATGEMLRRFENETQALGRLQHPGIAQIYDAGTAETPFGLQPYFAMELVRGQTLIEYCDQHQLNVRRRLQLAAKICDAVQHAHQRGLIHRDLKPANILVDEFGHPRILDFGVARLTDSDAQATRQTDIGQLIGTLAYMSPEQVLGDPQEIDTRSDVYALGVILYELLAGKGPYAIGRQMLEVIRTIREEEPSALSSINRAYRGDIETIVSKALEKDKARRYASAAELAADLRHHFHNEPILARPPSATYQLQKFARRHRALVAGVASVFVVLVLGIVASTWEAVQAKRAEARAQRETAIAQAVNNFLQKDLLGQASAYNQTKADPNLSVRTVLERAAQNLQGKFTQQPEVEIAIRETISRSERALGLYSQAMQQMETALALSRRTLGNDDPKTLKLLAEVGGLHQVAGKLSEGEADLVAAVEGDRRLLGPRNPQTLFAMDDLALIYLAEGKYAPAEALLKQTVDLERIVLGPSHPMTTLAVFDLGRAYYSEGKYDQAEAIHRQTLATERATLGPEHPRSIDAMVVLAHDLEDEGKLTDSEKLWQQVVDERRKVLGPEVPDTLGAAGALAWNYLREAQFAQAEALQKETLAIQLRRLGPEDEDTLQGKSNLATIYAEEGRYAEAEALNREALEGRLHAQGPDNPRALYNQKTMAWMDRMLGKTALAEAEDRQVLERYTRLFGPEDSVTLSVEGSLADVYADEGRYAQAAAMKRSILAVNRRVSGPNAFDTLNSRCDLAEVEVKQGDYQQAEDDGMQALPGMRHAVGLDGTSVGYCEAEIAFAYLSQGNFKSSQSLASEALETDKRLEPDNWERFFAASLLGESLAGQKKYEQADGLLSEGYQGMMARKDRIGVPDRGHLVIARQWLLQNRKRLR